MIPHVLHHIWLGPTPLPSELIEPWHALHPTWEHRLWREADIRAFGLRNVQLFERYHARGVWHGAANVARVEILERLGGVYVDMDTVPLRRLDPGPFMKPSVGLFCGRVQPREDYPGLVGNAYIGAIPHHPVLRTAMRLIASRDADNPPWIKSGVVPFSRAVESWQRRGRDDIYVAPTHVFYPEDKHGDPAPTGRGATYARHLWGSTIRSPWHYGDPT